MDSFVKFQNMLELKKPKDRREIPVYPMILTWCGTATGVKQSELVSSAAVWRKAMTATFQKVGHPDVSMPISVGNAIFAESMPARIPGRELDDNALFQFIEKTGMEPEDYKLIAKSGWNAFFNPYMMRIQNPPLKSGASLLYRYIRLGTHLAYNKRYFAKQNVAVIFDYAVYPAFDMISLIRAMEPFLCDLLEDDLGDGIHDALRRANPEIIKESITNCKRFGGTKICVYAMRSSCSFLSPAMFEEYAWPYLKEMILEYHKAGITTILHADGNWGPLMKYFLELPKGCVHFELDGATDLIPAYETVKGWHSLRGDVPASLLAFHSPDDVSAYCEKLLTAIGLQGGFMLGSGCEVPLNAKPENVRAMLQSVR